jgi:hypothetical protein
VVIKAYDGSDSAAKEILLRLDQQRPGSDKFVIKNGAQF